MSIFTSFFFSDTTSRDIHTLSLHDALPISETLCAAIAQPNDLYLTEPLQHLSGVDGVMFSGGVAEYVYGREERDFGDLGRGLGSAIRKRLESGRFPWRVLPAGECIRATAFV